MKTVGQILKEIDKTVAKLDEAGKQVTNTRNIWYRLALLDLKAWITNGDDGGPDDEKSQSQGGLRA